MEGIVMSDISTAVKKVNINAPIPIRTVTPNIYGKMEGVSMTPANILKCLIAKATVYEVLSDGSTCKLTFSNYNKVNKPIIKSTKPKDKVQKLVTKSGSAIKVTEVRRSKVIKSTKELISEADKDKTDNKSYMNMLNENSESTGIKVDELTDTLKDENGKEVDLPKETISEDKPAEANKISEEGEDPELAEIAAEIAKMEAEEAANKDKEK